MAKFQTQNSAIKSNDRKMIGRNIEIAYHYKAVNIFCPTFFCHDFLARFSMACAISVNFVAITGGFRKCDHSLAIGGQSLLDRFEPTLPWLPLLLQFCHDSVEYF
jgi:hypothetical protein